MKNITTTIILSCLLFAFSKAQSSAERVYTIFQTHCATAGCHNNVDAVAGLDLEGSAGSIAAQMQDVYNNIYKVTPQNTEAASKDNYLIYPGDPYRSFIYRKIDNGLSGDVHLGAGEGAVEPQNGGMMTDLEKETVRQWIVYGAQQNGTNYDYSVMEEYYTNGGIESIENAPAAPDPSEGFQLHVGPFYLAPGVEDEFMSLYETKLAETKEVYKFQTVMGEFSHHFIVYNFIDYATGAPIPENQIPVGYGLRSNIGFDDKGFVITEQYSNTLELPQGTAFEWQEGLSLDLNSHYINYSQTEVMKCEVYLNVYTQESGEAVQIMYSQLVPNTNLNIPNDGEEHTYNFQFPYVAGQFFNPLFADPQIHIWGMVSHTHAYGQDFDISINGDQIYDGGCANGVPGCAVEEFDYQHLPFRFYEPFIPFGNGDNMVATAKYLNDGPNDVSWGLTSSDEMMIFIMFFTLDTAGLNLGTDPTAIGAVSGNSSFNFYPNPVKDIGNLELNGSDAGVFEISIVDLSGRVVYRAEGALSETVEMAIPTTGWDKGLYLYQVMQNGAPFYSGKFAVE